MPILLRVVLSIVGLLIACLGAFLILREFSERHSDHDEHAKVSALGVEFEVRTSVALLALGVAISMLVWLLPYDDDDDDDDRVDPPVPTEPSTVTTELSELTIKVLEASLSTSQDRVRPENGPPLGGDGFIDLRARIEVAGGPTGLIATICTTEKVHTMTQWDTYTGNPPDDGPPFAPRTEHISPTFQLGVIAGEEVNPAVNLDEPLPDDVYDLYLSLEGHAAPPAAGDRLCVVALRDDDEIYDIDSVLIDA